MVNKNIFQKIIFTSLFVIITNQVFAQIPERRREPTLKQFGYIVAPAPFVLPGVGSGVMLTGILSNVPVFSYETPMDIIAIKTVGNVEAQGITVMDIPLFPDYLYLSAGRGSANKASVFSYRKRGMNKENKKEDYTLLELKNSSYQFQGLKLVFWEDRIKLQRTTFSSKSSLKAIRDRKGKLLQDLSGSKATESKAGSSSTEIDLTDDNADPRLGLRINYWVADKSKNSDPDESDGYKADVNVTGYIPLLTNSTLAINYFRSQFHVTRKGLIDEKKIVEKLKKASQCGSKCNDTIINQRAKETAVVNKYGNATSLGGRDRLRSYPQGRFKGGASEYRGAELRWNLTDENTPYNLWFMKDIRSNLQVAFSYGEGSVAEESSDLWNEKRSSVGVGFRVVSGSGLVYRLDYATGDEGGNTTLWVMYPWQDF